MKRPSQPGASMAPPARARRRSRSAPAHPRVRFTLSDDEVVVWRAALDDASPAQEAECLAMLSPDERGRAESFYFERDRRRFLVGRGILRMLVGQYLHRPPGEIAFQYGPNGKPTVANARGDAFWFNLAHSAGVAVFAFTRAGEVGVDLEWIRELADWEPIANTFFPRAELGRIHSRRGNARRDEFFAAWTRQEARVKADGAGLAALPERGGPREVWAESDLVVHGLRVGAGFAAAVACRRAIRRIVQFEWPAVAGENTAAPASAGTTFP